jgi:hypothetical protein
MVNSRFKHYGIFALTTSILLLIGCCFLIYILYAVVFLGSNIVPSGTLPPFGAIVFICFFVVIIIAIIYSMVRYPFFIEINEQKKIVIFKNAITQQRKEYYFGDFDGYLDTFAYNSKGGYQYKVIYLIKDKKAVRIISGFYYGNVDELQNALQPMKYLGFNKNYAILFRRAFLNRPIID